MKSSRSEYATNQAVADSVMSSAQRKRMAEALARYDAKQAKAEMMNRLGRLTTCAVVVFVFVTIFYFGVH